MTGHACPECGVHRPGCACARAELAAAEDFDPLRIRPYVTLDSAEDPPTAQLSAIRPGSPVHGGSDATPRQPDPYAAQPDPYAAQPDPYAAQPDPYADTRVTPYADAPGTPYGDLRSGAHPQADPCAHLPADHGGDPSETMPLLLHGVGRGDRGAGPADERAAARRRRRGTVVAAVAAVAVVGTAALAAAVLGGGDEGDDRATGLEITTSASLNVAVSEAPSPSASSETPEPSSSSPSVRPTATSASPSATSTPSASRTAPVATTGAAAPPAATTTAAPTTAAPTTAPATTAPPATQVPEEPTQPEETEESAATLSYGSSGPEVEELQQRLTLAGAYHGPIDGEYGQGVWRAVKSYQSWMFIEEDPKGVYGPYTREALERSTWL
ncbi:peptidoglycan-binding protein [Streptomyces sp. NPDC015130]|uniref:peptidoglycan-binding domain-containing protein n=1 Tax=Streptomyces sp. NPDC015130 TaxID=3364940 RepID=UPI0036FD6117